MITGSFCSGKSTLVVYILLHIYRHLLGEGIGLRQLLDYYYVLRRDIGHEDKEETLALLKQLRLYRFARGIMYVLQNVFGLEDRFLLCEPCVTDGEMLLSEILIAGNFGHYDPRIDWSQKRNGKFSVFVKRCRRNLRFVRYYPAEVICTPIFKIWHQFWRMYYQRV